MTSIEFSEFSDAEQIYLDGSYRPASRFVFVEKPSASLFPGFKLTGARIPEYVLYEYREASKEGKYTVSESELKADDDALFFVIKSDSTLDKVPNMAVSSSVFLEPGIFEPSAEVTGVRANIRSVNDQYLLLQVNKVVTGLPSYGASLSLTISDGDDVTALRLEIENTSGLGKF